MSAIKPPLLFASLVSLQAMSSIAQNVHILDISNDGKSLSLDVGASVGIRENEYGELYDLQREIVAEIESIKSNNTQSYWIVRKIYQQSAIQKHTPYQLEVLGTRLDIKKHDPETNHSENLPNETIFEINNFQEEDFIPKDGLDALEEIMPKGEPDFAIDDIDDLKSLEDITETNLSIDPVSKAISQSTNNNDRSNEEMAIVNPNARERIQRDGPLWSKGMTQRELRSFLIRTGIAKEEEYREKALHEVYSNEIFIRYRSALGVHTNPSFSTNKGINRSIIIGYELPLAWTSRYLHSWSSAVHYESANSFISLGSTNGSTRYAGPGLDINYYFYNKPYTIKKYMLYAGLGFSRGGGTIKTGLSEDTFIHQAISTSLNLGIKYRTNGGTFRSRFWDWGFSIIYGRKNTTHLINGATDETLPTNINFNTTISTTEHNLSLGMNLYF